MIGNPVTQGLGWARLLWWRVLDEFDSLFDVALQALSAGLDELLFLLGHALKNIDGLLSSVGLFLSSQSDVRYSNMT